MDGHNINSNLDLTNTFYTEGNDTDCNNKTDTAVFNGKKVSKVHAITLEDYFLDDEFDNDILNRVIKASKEDVAMPSVRDVSDYKLTDSQIDKKVKKMIKSCEHGRSTVIYYAGSKTSALLLWDTVKKIPVYITLNSSGGVRDSGIDMNVLRRDMFQCSDSRYKNRTVKLSGLDSKEILKKVKNSQKDKKEKQCVSNEKIDSGEYIISLLQSCFTNEKFDNMTDDRPRKPTEIALEIKKAMKEEKKLKNLKEQQNDLQREENKKGGNLDKKLLENCSNNKSLYSNLSKKQETNEKDDMFNTGEALIDMVNQVNFFMEQKTLSRTKVGVTRTGISKKDVKNMKGKITNTEKCSVEIQIGEYETLKTVFNPGVNEEVVCYKPNKYVLIHRDGRYMFLNPMECVKGFEGRYYLRENKFVHKTKRGHIGVLINDSWRIIPMNKGEFPVVSNHESWLLCIDGRAKKMEIGKTKGFFSHDYHITKLSSTSVSIKMIQSPETISKELLSKWISECDCSVEKEERVRAAKYLLIHEMSWDLNKDNQVYTINLESFNLTTLPISLFNIPKNCKFTIKVNPENNLDKRSLEILYQLSLGTNFNIIYPKLEAYNQERITYFTNEIDKWQAEEERARGGKINHKQQEIFTYLKNMLKEVKIAESNKFDYSNCNFHTIPDFLRTFPQILSFNISGNPKLKEIPRFIFDMEKLENLTANGCNIKNISNEISKLRNLKVLSLSDNSLTQLPDSLTELGRLKQLNVNNNMLKQLPNNIDRLINLKELAIRSNEICHLPNLCKCMPKDIIIYAEGNFISDWSNVDHLYTVKNFDKTTEVEQNRLLLKARKLGCYNARGFSIKAGDNHIILMGCQLPDSKLAPEFFTKYFDNAVFLVEPNEYIKTNDKDQEINIDQVNQIKVNAKDSFQLKHKDKSLNIQFTPIEDFKVPELEQFKIVHNQQREARAKNKSLLIACEYGGGRTGTMLTSCKITQDFMSLPADKKELYEHSMERNFEIYKENGTFSHLDKIKSTSMVATAINGLRKNEGAFPDGCISVETNDQIKALEFWELILFLNHMVKSSLWMEDKDIADIIMEHSEFNSGFLKMFAPHPLDKSADLEETSHNLREIIHTIRTLKV